MKKVVLAYSGGLDTSCAITWLKDKGYKVIAFMADVGQGKDYLSLKNRALKAGASKVYIQDLKNEFIQDFIWPALKADAVYEGKYLLATALSRPLIAKYLVSIARQEKAQFIAHGCTGKGNDQVRFEVSAEILNPKIKIIAPVRSWEFKSREEEIEYAQRKDIPLEVTKKKPYSIDINLWGVSIECGVLEDPWQEPPEDIYQWTKNPVQSPHKPSYCSIEFKQGIPFRINGKGYPAQGLIKSLNQLAAKHGVGRSDLIENRLIGIKSREIYEAPAATVLHLAHKELECLVLDRETLHFKDLISSKYAQLIYYGLWYSDLRKALDKFIQHTQEKVSGIVKIKLHKGKAVCVGRKSKHSLYKQELATYSDKDRFNQSLAEGFIRLWGLPHIH